MENTLIENPSRYTKIHGWFDYEGLYTNVFKTLGDSAHIVEVGCWLGRSVCFMAELIKSSGKTMRFDCVDTWRVPLGATGLTPWVQGNKFSQVHDFVNNLDQAGILDLINVVQLSSFEAVNVYAPMSLDFVFLDNDHSETHVFNELNAWWPKIKKGGVLAGHDFIESDWPGVVNAVKRFAALQNCNYEVLNHSYLLRR